MLKHLFANLWLVAITLLLCAVAYPLLLLGIGRTLFPAQAEGSLLRDADNTVIGSRLIAQPFTGDEYFQPRPSAASYNGAASGASNFGSSNYKLRDRVARTLGPIVRYRGGSRKGELVAPDVEAWFQKDQNGGKPGIVAQWAGDHNGLAQDWVKADKLNTAYVADWMTAHAAEVAQWVKDNPTTPEPKPEDVAVPFFTSFSVAHPGLFPSIVTDKAPDGKETKSVKPVKEGGDIQSIFFDMWRQENPDAELEDVPADLVMASGSGLDPHITVKNARYQLDRVVGAWAQKTKLDKANVRRTIEDVLREKTFAVLGGSVGPPIVNVLEVNLAVRERLAAAK